MHSAATPFLRASRKYFSAKQHLWYQVTDNPAARQSAAASLIVQIGMTERGFEDMGILNTVTLLTTSSTTTTEDDSKNNKNKDNTGGFSTFMTTTPSSSPFPTFDNDNNNNSSSSSFNFLQPTLVKAGQDLIRFRWYFYTEDGDRLNSETILTSPVTGEQMAFKLGTTYDLDDYTTMTNTTLDFSDAITESTVLAELACDEEELERAQQQSTGSADEWMNQAQYYKFVKSIGPGRFASSSVLDY